MEMTRQIGQSGIRIAPVVMGMWQAGKEMWAGIDDRETRRAVRAAFEAGINAFDTAEMYGKGHSERILAEATADIRPKAVYMTKVFSNHLRYDQVVAACHRSLKNLRTDYIDLYQIHRFDPSTPIEETMEALHDLVRAGKVRYLGASSMWAWQFAKMQQVAERHGWTRFISMQNHYNLAYREEEREMIPLARDQGVGLLPWSPLARGFLAGNRGRDDRAAGVTARARTDDIALKLYYQDSDFEVLAALQALAVARGISSAKLAYAWLLARPGVTAPIVGASQTWQLEEAVQALDLKLSIEDTSALEEPYRPHPILGHT